ncbi:MAG: substrate-binding domain-containing protein [Candidatus Bathyarchaeia archaeon]
MVAALTLAVIIGVFAYDQYLRFQRSVIVLATTTSTYDSGLLDYLIPIFQEKYAAEVHIIPVGTGQAIEIAKRGDADLILVHSRQLELEFVNSGYGVHRVCVMCNDFIIIGPADDPAGIGGLKNATEAFRKIAEEGAKNNAKFISRADKSGTHMLELNIWAMLNLTLSNKTQTWYIEAGAGMGAVLRMANEKKAYTLTDRATWVSFKNQLANLQVLVEGDIVLLNSYALILVNPDKYPHRNYKAALLLAKWLISEDGQNLIANFKKEGEPLFKPIVRDIELVHTLGFPEQEKELAWYDAQNP